MHRVELLKGGEALGLSDDAEGNADVPSEPSLASDVDGCSTGAPSEDEDGASSFVPAFSRRPGDTRQIWRQVRTDVFSYSSVAEAAHEGSLLEDLARRFCTGVDAHADAAQMSPSPATAPAGDTEAASGKVARRAFYDDADAAAWDAGDALASDQDKATDFGTAFHRLAQLAARQHVPGKALACPSRVRVDALMRSAGLAVRERRRLSSALNRWFSSDLAADMAPLNLSAEVPFFIQLDNGGSPIYLEGEIDLLGIGDADDGAYFIVDYKTGGNAAETEDQLAAKHVLQATCYAYAALKKGARTVSISFVRVEQEAKAGAGQPQCVRYRFESADAPDLARAIVEAYRKARATESAGAQQG